ncbi:MAG: hypothetical protein BWY95_02152 [Bacteroidetes bacterium ADurb.BinA104]|nr:MAG: hypothetical protein BWY95_02152 [Bacteroidetes bacterium ADurb.BinA104]
MQQLLFLLQGFLLPLLKSPVTRIWLEVLEVIQDNWDQCARFLTPTGPRNVDFSGTPHAVSIQIRIKGVSDLPSAVELNQFIQEAIVLHLLQIINYFWIRTNHISYI